MTTNNFQRLQTKGKIEIKLILNLIHCTALWIFMYTFCHNFSHKKILTLKSIWHFRKGPLKEMKWKLVPYNNKHCILYLKSIIIIIKLRQQQRSWTHKFISLLFFVSRMKRRYLKIIHTYRHRKRNESSFTYLYIYECNGESLILL